MGWKPKRPFLSRSNYGSAWTRWTLSMPASGTSVHWCSRRIRMGGFITERRQSGPRSKPPPEPSPIHSRRRKECRSVHRYSVLSVFAFYRLDPGQCTGQAAKGEHSSANQDLYTRALHMHRREGVMAEGERTA